jgi:hypothetical protein
MGDWLFRILIGLVLTPLALLGLLLTLGAVSTAVQRGRLMLFGGRAVGRVVGFAASKPSPQEPTTVMDLAPPTPYLRIAFTDERGQLHEVTTDISVSPKKFKKGDPAPLLYAVGHPQTFAVRRFGLMWGAPLLMAFLGLALLAPALAALGYFWPPFGEWAVSIVRPLAFLLVPVLAVGLPGLFALLGMSMILQRLRRLREDHRTEGVVVETGVLRSGGRHYHWMEVAYRDATGAEQTRKLSTGFGAARPEGRMVPLLVDRAAPQDVLVNESGELWFLPVMCLVIGSLVMAVGAWAWWTGELSL